MTFLRLFWRRQSLSAMALGRLIVTPAAASALKRADVTAESLVRRHAAGDWGNLDALDVRQNLLGVRLGLRVRSVYVLPGRSTARGMSPTERAVWVIAAPNRRTTTVLLPSEIFDDANEDDHAR